MVCSLQEIVMDKIYTKTGDRGETSLFSGERVGKDNPLVEAYGTVDELNSVIGMARALHTLPDKLAEILAVLQHELLELGAHLAYGKPGAQRIRAEQVEQLEHWIDELQAGMQPLGGFILPGGHPVAAQLHIARTVCRRAERLVIRAMAGRPYVDELALKYINRLSDLLFILAREANRAHGQADVKWEKRD
jgi:cob(I)alamin adenosyltransferase